MAEVMPASREFMSTLAAGWRFTLPARLREAKGWDEGSYLAATASDGMLVISEDAGPGLDSGSGLDSGPGSRIPVRLGSGGKVIVPVALRPALQWEVGKRLVVVDDDGDLSIAPCCGVKRCRSCGSIAGVREVIPNLYLCADCWEKYSRAVRSRPVQVKARSW